MQTHDTENGPPAENPRAALVATVQKLVEDHPSEDTYMLVDLLFECENPKVLAWARVALGAMVRQARAAAQADPRQMLLPGFKSLAQKIPLRDKRLHPLGQLTIPMLRESMVVIDEKLKQAMTLSLSKIQANAQNRRSKRREDIQALINSMEPYAKTTKLLTVERWCDLVASGVAAPAR